MYETSVLIVGAGPTGLTLAIDLMRRGIPCRLIEAADSPFLGSRGKGIQPRTLEIFDDLGIVEPILAAGGLYPKLRIHVGPFSVRAGSLGPPQQPTESVPYPNLWMVPQSRTESIMRERLRSLGGEVEFGMPLVSFQQHQDGAIAALSTGDTIRAAYLVGCDGARSVVRKTLGINLEGETLDDKPILVADVGVDALDRRHWHIWPFAKGGVIGLCPLPETTPGTSLFQLTARAETIGDDIQGVVGQAIGQRIGRVFWRSLYRPAVRMVNRYRVGRVFLAGDAAHVNPPAGGQGLNTGVQDAYNLGWKLASVLHGAPETLLDSYESERLPIAASVLGMSKRLHRTPTIKRGDATNQLALHYRSSSLSSGEVFNGLHPGDRMPDLILDDGTRLFERMRGSHPSELAAPDGTRILIRPDGYIARIGKSSFTEFAGQATQYFKTKS